jgi:hypothetical protein
MDALLIGVAALSLTVALGTSCVAWRAVQAEKRRRAARIAALAAAGATSSTGLGSGPEAPVRVSGGQTAPWPSPEAAPTGEGLAAFASELGARGPAPAEPVARLSMAEPTVTVPSGFLVVDAPVRESGAQRGLAVAAAALALLLGGSAYLRMSATPASAHARQAARLPLELLSLRHEREGANLSVAGLVRNPPAGAAVEQLSAVVLLFDQQGTFVTSAHAPVDDLTLAAGDESPFVVKVQAPPTVARYRVSFRTDRGTLPHVDRRGEAPLAAPVALTTQ